MIKNYKYPRVGVSSTSSITSTVIPEVEDTSVLFVPIMSDFGPNNTIIRAHDLDEYTSYFGTPSFKYMGITTQLITRWLNNGGTIYAYRMIDPRIISDTTEDDGSGNIIIIPGSVKDIGKFSLNTPDIDVNSNVVSPAFNFISFDTKYGGEYYNGVKVTITPVSTNTDAYNITIEVEGSNLATEQFSRISGATLISTINNNSKLITNFSYDISNLFYSTMVDTIVTTRPAKLYDLVKNGTSSITLQMGAENNEDYSISSNIVYHTGIFESDVEITYNLNKLKINTTQYEAQQYAKIGTEVESTDTEGNIITYTTEKYTRTENSVFKVETSGDVATYYELIYKNFAQPSDTDSTGGDIFELFYNISATTIDNIVDTGWENPLKLQVFNSCWRILDETAREDFAVVFADSIVEERLVDGVYVADGKIKKPQQSYIFGAAASGSDYSWTGIPYTYVLNGETTGQTQGEGNNGWFTVWRQYGIITDGIYNSNADLYVPTTIGYANNVVYNDLNISMHVPTAGEIYGRLNMFKQSSISINPNAQTKDTWFKDRFNYIEQTSRNMDIMTNRTFYHPDSFEAQSALDFTNNVRVKNKMVRDIRAIMRRYLYQYADGDTLLRCTNECTAYINGWITNKALIAGSIEIQLDEYTDEYVNAVMRIQFRNCIEFINVNIFMD